MATLDELINSMYDMVQDAKGIPLANEKCIIERDHMLDLLDELRATLPGDLQAAQDIVAKRSEMLASGKREAEAIRRQAEEDARQMVSETEKMCRRDSHRLAHISGGILRNDLTDHLALGRGDVYKRQARNTTGACRPPPE